MENQQPAAVPQEAPSKKTRLGQKFDECVEKIDVDYKALYALKEELLTQSRILSDLSRDSDLLSNPTKKRDFGLVVNDIDHVAERIGDELGTLISSLGDLKERAYKNDKAYAETLGDLKQSRKSFHDYASQKIAEKRRLKKKNSLTTEELRDKALEKVNDFLNPEISLADIGD